MDDGLTISGGGSTAVATAGLFEQARELHTVIIELDDCLARLESIDRGISGAELRAWNAKYRAFAAEARIDDAVTALRVANATARSVVQALGASAEAYGLVERTLQGLSQALAAKFAYVLGFAFPWLAFLFGPTLASSAASGALAYAMMPGEKRESLHRWLADQNEIVTTPGLVTLVRLGVMSADDFGGGVARVSPQLLALLGDEGLGLLGLTTSAGLLAAAVRPYGALAETPVRVNRVSTRAVDTPATTFEERARRIPQGDSQVRIDRFHTDGQPDRFEVYIGGTKDLSLVAGKEPWDMTSNVNALSMGDAGSYRAVEEAMRLAGIEADSPVQFAGHSQGGLVASALASSGDYNAQGLFTVGGVVSQRLVPEGVPWLAIEHTDDLVPALGGNRSAPDAVLVRRQAFADEAVPSETVLPAHELTRYRQTAAMLDGSDDGRSGPILERLNNLGAGAETVTTTRYLARRVTG
ncbi:hypothetical protein ACX3O0_12580 [Homoserinimonas sp. A447]